MKWEPVDIIRVVALIGGFLLCGVGALLMWMGVGAEGVVDIKSPFVTGGIKSGSAGLFIIFFGALIVFFVLSTLTLRPSSNSAVVVQRQSAAVSLKKGFKYLIGSMIVCGALAAVDAGRGFGLLAGVLGFMAFMTGFAYVLFAAEE